MTCDTHTYCRAFSSGAVTCYLDLGPRLGFEPPTVRLRGERSNIAPLPRFLLIKINSPGYFPRGVGNSSMLCRGQYNASSLIARMFCRTCEFEWIRRLIDRWIDPTSYCILIFDPFYFRLFHAPKSVGEFHTWQFFLFNVFQQNRFWSTAMFRANSWRGGIVWRCKTVFKMEWK